MINFYQMSFLIASKKQFLRIAEWWHEIQDKDWKEVLITFDGKEFNTKVMW